MTYGMLASESCLLTDISDMLHEKTKKKNTAERFTRHLDNSIPKEALRSYLSMIRSWVPVELVIHVDDSDVAKPDGYKGVLSYAKEGIRLWFRTKRPRDSSLLFRQLHLKLAA